jgi:RNA polymerase sigma-70 factor (ECF subfamily)
VSGDPERQADLALARACAAGDAAAVRELERLFLSALPAKLARLEADRSLVSETVQELRAKLLVGEKKKIAEYAGRGPLASWLFIAATRTLHNLRRTRRREETRDELASMAVADPELHLIKQRDRAAVSAALRFAFESLDPRERNLLRLHYGEGLSVVDIAALHRVHRATATRWIASCNASLMERARRELRERLRMGGPELRSLLGLVRSELGTSLSRLLA